MKSTKQPETVKEELSFPKLMVSETHGNIYLMQDKGRGTRVYSKTNDACTGKYYTCLRSINMVDYHGSVTLEN